MFLQVSSLCKSLCRSTECLLLESWQMLACMDCIWNWHLAEARPCDPCIASRPCPKVASREKSVQAIWIIWTSQDKLECEALRVAFFRAAFVVLDAFASGPRADTTPSCSLQSGGPQSLLQATCFSQIAAYTFQTSFADLSTRPTSDTKTTVWLMWLAIPLNNIWPGAFPQRFAPQCHETWHESNAGGWFGCFSIRSTSCFRWLGDQMFLKACQFQPVRSEWLEWPWFVFILVEPMPWTQTDIEWTACTWNQRVKDRKSHM